MGVNNPPIGGGVGGTGITRTETTITTATTAGATALTDYTYFVSGTTTLTLPTAIGNANLYTVKNTGVATVTVATNPGTQTIDGTVGSIELIESDSVDLISNGSNWLVV